MKDADLLSAAIAASGLGMREFVRDVLQGYPKNVRNMQRWLAGENPLPITVREQCATYLVEAATEHLPNAQCDSAKPRLLSLAEAEAESGIRSSTLRVQLNAGRITGEKRGRDWVIDAAELQRYMASRSPRGRKPASELAGRPRPPRGQE